MGLTSLLGLGALWDMPSKTPDIPPIIVKVLDELPAHVGPNYPIPMPRKKASPKQKAFDWKHLKRPSWEKPTYSLEEIAKACPVESYAARSIDKHREHVLRHGWDWVGRNDKTVAYIRKRMSELSESMGRPVEKEIRKAIRNYIKFSNGFLAWTRDRNITYRSRHRKSRYHPTGLFSMNATCMRYRRDKKNRILEWYQVVGNDEESLKDVDVVHLAFDQDEGFILGVPFILPVLDDILTWRRFEEIAEIMYHKFAYPLYHHKIGEKDHPPEEYDDSTNEIGEASSIVSGMAPEGHLFTSHRHIIEVVGAKTTALDILPMLKYWEERVLAGLNLSALDIGRGDTANRSTADTLSKGLADRCAEYQNEFAIDFTFHILDELLIEGGYDLTPENRVSMHFPAIDREAKRADETHQTFLYQGNAITHSEMRTRMGQLPFNKEEWKDTFFEQVTKPTALIKSIDESSGLGSTASVSNAARPANQHGTKPTKTKVTKDALNKILTQFDSTKDPELLKALLHRADDMAMEALNAGILVYNEEYGEDVYLGQGLMKGFMADCIEPPIRSALQVAVSIQAALPSLSFYFDLIPPAGRNYAFARAAQIASRRNFIRWRLSDSACEECRSAPPTKIRRFLLGQVIPRHSECVLASDVQLEVSDKMTQEEYLRAEARLIKAGQCLDSLIEGQIKDLPDEAFCGPNRTFPVIDDITAHNATRILNRDRTFTMEEQKQINSAISARVASLGK